MICVAAAKLCRIAADFGEVVRSVAGPSLEDARRCRLGHTPADLGRPKIGDVSERLRGGREMQSCLALRRRGGSRPTACGEAPSLMLRHKPFRGMV
jgi:hypothetical protein